jgi:hypothetical protein
MTDWIDFATFFFHFTSELCTFTRHILHCTLSGYPHSPTPPVDGKHGWLKDGWFSASRAWRFFIFPPSTRAGLYNVAFFSLSPITAGGVWVDGCRAAGKEPVCLCNVERTEKQVNIIGLCARWLRMVIEGLKGQHISYLVLHFISDIALCSIYPGTPRYAR